MSDFGVSPIEPTKNNEYTRVCHRCKGKLVSYNIKLLTDGIKSIIKLDLACNKCQVIYYIEDDKMIGIMLDNNYIQLSSKT